MNLKQEALDISFLFCCYDDILIAVRNLYCIQKSFYLVAIEESIHVYHLLQLPNMTEFLYPLNKAFRGYRRMMGGDGHERAISSFKAKD